MRKFKVLFWCFFLFAAITVGQQKKYVTYKVKQGETMKSIAKQYRLSTRDLMRLNPGESRKPAPNTVIVVPNLNFGKVVEIKKPELKTYRVKPQETEFGISSMNGISVEQLRAANPQLKDGLKIGMLLNIPPATVAIPKDSLNFVLHTVVKDDTFYNITRRYEVGQEDLYRLNPVLKEEGLRLGLLLKIKPRPLDEELVDEEEDDMVEDLNLNKRLKVVLMLPYQLNKLTDSLLLESFNRQRSMQNIASDFQMGSLMAIDSLRAKGLDVSVDYFDTEYSRFTPESARIKMQYLLNSYDFNKADVVIGPLFFDNAFWLSKRISPLVLTPFYSGKQSGMSSKNLVKTSPDDIVYEEKVMSYMEKVYDGQNIVVVNDAQPENQSRLWRVVNRLKAMDSVPEISVLKPEENTIDPEVLKVKLDSMASNWVVIITDESVTTSAAVNGLKTFAERMEIDLFGFKKGRNYEVIDNKFLGKLNFVFATSEFLNPDDDNVKNFYAAFERKNHAVPSNYAIRGFDVTYDALVRLASANAFNDGFRHGMSDRLAGRFNFNKKLFGSYENKGVYLIQYTESLTPILLKDEDEETD